MNKDRYISPGIFAPYPDLVAAQSTRHGGVSGPPYRSLNLGRNTGDDPARVRENIRLFCSALAVTPEQLAWVRQVHGDGVVEADSAGFTGEADALVTGRRGLVLGVSVADCAPVLVFDRRNRAVAAIHAGWRGTHAGIVGKALRVMAERYGTLGADCLASIGACIDVCDYEVGAEVALQFAPEFRMPEGERYRLDLKAANLAQLRDFGIPEDQIAVSGYSTASLTEHFFSHRAEKGTTGRMLAVIGMR